MCIIILGVLSLKHEEISLNTKRELARALKEAMKKKPFQKITVSALVDACGVNRKTFYYHFEDIRALLKWVLEEESIEVVKGFDLLVDYEEAITFVMNYVEENEHILNCAYDALGRDELKRFFYSDFLDISRTVIEEAEAVEGVRLEDGYREFLCAFYTNAVSGMLTDWVRYRDKRERETVARYLSTAIIDSLHGILSGTSGK